MQESTLDAITTALSRARKSPCRQQRHDHRQGSPGLRVGTGRDPETSAGPDELKDADGNYLFSGSKTDTAPYSQNTDGTYSYNGDQTTINLGIGDGLAVGTNYHRLDAFQQTINTGRTKHHHDRTCGG